MKRTIFHIDVNSAYLSWTAVEQLKNGTDVDIRTIPSIIGGDQKSRHGVVLAKSIPAKAYGIHTGEPVANALRKCPVLQMFPPDHKMYHRKSEALMEYLSDFCPDIEQVSVDECYMDVTEIVHRYGTAVALARQIKDGVKENFGFTVNVGISENKLLAKMASDFEKPDKIHTLFRQEISEKMWPLPLGKLFMAGHSSVEQLKKLEILTIGDLAKSDPELITLQLKSHGRMLWEFANGIDDSAVHPEQSLAKGIGNSTTLREDITEEEAARRVLLRLAESVGERLRKAGQIAGMVSVEIKYHTFQRVSHQKQLEVPSSADETIYQTACALFHELWNGEAIRLLGIRTSKLKNEEEPRQISLFEFQTEMGNWQKKTKNTQDRAGKNALPEKNEKEQKDAMEERRKKLSEAVDAIRKRYGRSAITRGVFPEKEEKEDE